MENKRFLSNFELPDSLPGLSPERRRLYQFMQSALVYVPVLLGFNFLGFLIIYLLGVTGALGQGSPALLVVGAISLIASFAHTFLYAPMREGKIETAASGLMVITGVATILQVFLWEKIAWFLIIQGLGIVLVFVLQRELRFQYRLLGLLFGLLTIITILTADDLISYQRISLVILTHMAAFTIYLTVIAMMVMLVAINGLLKFNTIAARLTLTFTLVATLATLSTLVVAGIASLYHEQQRMLGQLSTVSNLKLSQIQSLLTGLERDAAIAVEDPIISQRIRFLLRGTSDKLLYQFNDSLVRADLTEIQIKGQAYNEFLLMDLRGNVVLSTVTENEARNFGEIPFFQQALNGNLFYIENRFPRAQGTSLLILKQVFEGSEVKGILVARTRLELVTDILKVQGNAGKTLETYMVGPNFRPITKTQTSTAIVKTIATSRIFDPGHLTGTGIYPNYADKTVLGHYTWLPELQVALITEIEQSEVVQNIFIIMATNMLIGLFTISIAFAAVLLASRSISRPITNLAEKATALASGDFSTRIDIDRQDEIGALAASFNTMAGEFQALVRTLEQRVDDRTRDLQKQANRMRLAAEVARDATTARDLSDLLNRSAQLVLERFNLYHTGIFLIDIQREYAVLKASTTDAGRQMLENNHRLKIGATGIVGFVAATGQPRIALDTGQDAVYLNNPLLPLTRSEMALPLKVENLVIGVLDAQSELPEAFTQDDVAVLQIMADQLALAIQRVQLVQQLEESIRETELASESFTVTSWRNLSQGQGFTPGYTYDGIKISPISDFPPGSQEALRRGKAVLLPGKDSQTSLLAAPLKLRDQVIGILNIRFNSPNIGAETLSLVEETANRLAISLENARLYTETQNLAQRERMVSEITARIVNSTNIENILRTAVQELGGMLPDAEVTVEIQEGKR